SMLVFVPRLPRFRMPPPVLPDRVQPLTHIVVGVAEKRPPALTMPPPVLPAMLQPRIVICATMFSMPAPVLPAMVQPLTSMLVFVPRSPRLRMAPSVLPDRLQPLTVAIPVFQMAMLLPNSWQSLTIAVGVGPVFREASQMPKRLPDTLQWLIVNDPVL